MIEVGRGTYIVPPCHEYCDPIVHIGNFCSIADGVTFCGAHNHAWVGDKKIVSTCPFGHIWPHLGIQIGNVSRGPIIIGNDVWVGKDAFFMDGVTIGDGAIVGAKAVVAKDISPYAIAVGNPAKVIRYRFSPNRIEKLLRMKWWDWDDQTIQARVAEMLNIDTFLERYG
jgi:acetyltransferase-like isoleucine patch superfamily enzyme